MSLVQWECHFKDSDPVTVGAPKALSCQGENSGFQAEGLKIEALNQPEYSIQLLQSTFEQGRAELQVTFYRVGQFDNVELIITSGQNIARTSAVSWSVQSVIDPQNPEAGQPFGPFGPWKMDWPLWYFIILAVLIIAALFAGIRTWRKVRRSREVKKEIEDYLKKFDPFDQFQKTLRALDRNLHSSVLKNEKPNLSQIRRDLFNAVQIYLMTEFRFDSRSLSPGRTVRFFKKRFPSFDANKFSELGLLLSELSKSNEVQVTELEKILDWAGRLSEVINTDNLGSKK